MFNCITSTKRRNTIPWASPAGSGNCRAIKIRRKKLILYRSNVAQFNKRNLSLITIIYCSSYTPPYQQKNTTFSSLRTDEPIYPLTQCHIPEDSNPFLLSCISKQKYRMYISNIKFQNDMTLSPNRDSWLTTMANTLLQYHNNRICLLTVCFHFIVCTSSSWMRWASFPRAFIFFGSSFWYLQHDTYKHTFINLPKMAIFVTIS